MKSIYLIVLCIGLSITRSNSQENIELKTWTDTISYCIGLDIGKNLKNQSIEINPTTLARAISDVSAGKPTTISEQDAQSVMLKLRQDRVKAIGEKNKREGDAFLEHNKTQEGVKSTASGLQYKILVAGNGPQPKATDKVVVHYVGTLIDKTEFDSSLKRGTPTTHPVNGFIKGWSEALQLMSVGSKWQLFIPSDLAYGPQGTGKTIGPNATLIFEIELLSISNE